MMAMSLVLWVMRIKQLPGVVLVTVDAWLARVFRYVVPKENANYGYIYQIGTIRYEVSFKLNEEQI